MAQNVRWTIIISALALAAAGLCCRAGGGEASPPEAAPTTTQTIRAPEPTRKPPVFVTRTPRPAPSATPGGDAWTCSPGTQDVRVFSAGKERLFRIHVPPGITEAERAPLVLSIHGHSASAEMQEAWSEFTPLADREGFIVVYPQALHNPAAWDVEPHDDNLDIPYFQTLLDNVEAHCPVDPQRVYVTGASNGGGMTHRLACTFARRFAAAAPVVGAYPWFNDCKIKRAVPILIFHGTADEIVLYEGTGGLGEHYDQHSVWPPIPYFAQTWATWNVCAPRPEAKKLAGGVLKETWSGCDEGAEVVLYTVDGGGHVWFGNGSTPVLGSGFHASRIIWEFFRSHPLPAASLPTGTLPP